MAKTKPEREPRMYEARVALAAWEADGRPGEDHGQFNSYLAMAAKVFDAVAASDLVVARRLERDDEIDRLADLLAGMIDQRRCDEHDGFCRGHKRPSPCPFGEAEAWLDERGLVPAKIAKRRGFYDDAQARQARRGAA